MIALVEMHGPGPSATISPVTALVVHREVVDSRPPDAPPQGPVDVGLGLLLARTAGPISTEARAALAAYFTTADPAPVRVGAAASGLSTAQVRTWVGQAARLAAMVGPPQSLLDAVALLRSRTWQAGDATAALADAGLTTERVHPASVLRLGGLYRLPDLPQSIMIGGRSWVVPATTATELRHWRRRAATRMAVMGLAPLSALPKPPRGYHLSLSYGTLGDPSDIHFDSDWVWRTDSKGRIPRLARTMLLAGPQTAETIAAGLRDVRMTVPPVEVLDKWLDTVPWARRTATGRFTARSRDPSVLGRWDRAILDHAQVGRPLTTAALAATLRLDRNHLGATLRRCILLEHASYGHWRLRRANGHCPPN